MKRMILWKVGLFSSIFLVIFYLLLTFVVLPHNETPVPAEAEVIEITFWDIAWDRSDYIQHMRNLAGDFNRENPRVRVVYESKPFEYYYQIFSSSIASGENPDICVIPSAMMVHLARLGFLLPVDDVRQPEAQDDFIADSLDQLTMDGQLMGIPHSVDQLVLYVRSDLLKEYGLEAPVSLADFQTLAQSLRYKDVSTLAFPCGGAAGARSLFHLMIQGGGTIGGSSGGLSISDPADMSVFSMINTLYNMGALPPEQEALDEEAVLRLFMNGETVCALARPSAYRRMRERNPEFSANVKVVPALDGYSGVANSGTMFINAMCVFKNTDNREAVMEFAQWWQTNSAVIWYKDALGVSPARRSTLNNLAQKDGGFSNAYSNQIAPLALSPTYPLINSPLLIVPEAKSLLKDVLLQCFTKEGVSPEWAHEYDLYLDEWSRVFQK